MLPMTLQFLTAMVSHALNERMAHRVEYLQEEVRVAPRSPCRGDRQDEGATPAWMDAA
jgi:hypothetical protein